MTAEESGYELTEEQKEALAAAGQQLVEAFKSVWEELVKTIRQIAKMITAVAKEVGKLNMDKWQFLKLEESNNHKRMHGRPMVRRIAIIRSRKYYRGNQMKAYKVWTDDSEYATIIFAESANFRK